MIVSHKHRFIFLRTEKTAGSSIEFALAELCGPEDIVTGINSEAAARLGLTPGAGRPRWTRRLSIRTGGLRRALPQYFGIHTHASAAEVRQFLPRHVFGSYFKFAVERNPWDRQVSLYYERAGRQARPADFSRDMSSLIYRKFHYTKLRNWQAYTINDQIVVDELIRFESLAEGLANVAAKLGLPNAIELGKRRSGSRPSLPYRDLYTSKTKHLIENWYRNEIDAFGYQF